MPPAGNRVPEPEEVQACLPYLRAQVKLIAPAHQRGPWAATAGAL
jgi:uracil-DNA glycosylase